MSASVSRGPEGGRRSALAAVAWGCVGVGAMSGSPAASWAVRIATELAPTGELDGTDAKVREAVALFQGALGASTVEEEERLWTAVIDRFGKEAEAQAAAGAEGKGGGLLDVVARAWGNRGNARSRQGKLESALQDYGESMRLAPYAVDPYLNRGAVLEAMGRFDDAIEDYTAVLESSPDDPAAWNNLGNAEMGRGNYAEGRRAFERAVQLAPGSTFAFAELNLALSEYEVGVTARDKGAAVKRVQNLLRRYPTGFDDARAALAAMLWDQGLEARAEDEWLRVDDPRYRDAAWLASNRRWPPSIANALANFRSLVSTNAAAAN